MKKKVAIIGGGAAALSLASFLDSDKFEIALYEKNKALGRKFLVAGKGGFNLTHSEPIAKFISRYTPGDFLHPALSAFTNEDFRIWLASIGVTTFVGSSNRVYPNKGTKPIEVLKAIELAMAHNSVKVYFEKTWTGWKESKELQFSDETTAVADIVVFALGGGSWKITGSDGSWLPTFAQQGIKTNSFLPSNCAFKINWKKEIVEKFAGKPLKNISITCGEKVQKGEVVLSQFGLEGNAIYGLSAEIRTQLTTGIAKIAIDFKPTFSVETLLEKASTSKAKNTTDFLKNELKLSSLQIGLIKSYLSKDEFIAVNILIRKIKHFPLEIEGIADLDEAISTVGGIDLSELSPVFELIKQPNTYCIGEMTDWDAPTGGYLLQACFSMGYYLANHLNNR